MKVLSYRQYQMAEDLANFIANPIINESDDKGTQIDSILKKLSNDLRFNYRLVFTFGVGVSYCRRFNYKWCSKSRTNYGKYCTCFYRRTYNNLFRRI